MHVPTYHIISEREGNCFKWHEFSKYFKSHSFVEQFWLNICIRSGSTILRGFLKTTDHLPLTIYQPTNDQPNTDQMHQPPTNRPPTSKIFEDQKKSEFIFDITYNFNTEFLKSCSASCTLVNCLGNIIVCLCVFQLTVFFFCCFQGRQKNCYQKVIRKAHYYCLVKGRY